MIFIRSPHFLVCDSKCCRAGSTLNSYHERLGRNSLELVGTFRTEPNLILHGSIKVEGQQACSIEIFVSVELLFE